MTRVVGAGNANFQALGQAPPMGNPAAREALEALGLPPGLEHTRFAQLLAAGYPTVTVYSVLPSGRIREQHGIEDPQQAGHYLTERQTYSGYPLGWWTGQLTPGEAVADHIGRTSIDLERARKRVARLERSLARYEAAQDALARGG